MSDNVYKVVQLIGSAPDSIEAAVDNALARAGQSLEIAVNILNHSTFARVFTVKPNVPEGFRLEDPKRLSGQLPSHRQSGSVHPLTWPGLC